MGEKHNNNNESEKKKKDGGDKDSLTVVLKVEMHCGGCASKIVKFVKSLEGVDCVKTEWEASKLTVTGKVDPVKIRDKLAEKTKKKIDLVSPQPKKDDKGKSEEKKQEEKKQNQKEPPVTTAVLKLSLHCQGCIDKIIKILGKTDGIHEKSIDKEKDLVTVKGTMDAKALVETLKKNLKRAVEIVPPKKDKDDKEKDKEGGGKKGGNGGDAQKLEVIKMEYLVAPGLGYFPVDAPYPNPYPQDGYGYAYPVPHPQIFSDENVNACTVM